MRGWNCPDSGGLSRFWLPFSRTKLAAFPLHNYSQRDASMRGTNSTSLASSIVPIAVSIAIFVAFAIIITVTVSSPFRTRVTAFSAHTLAVASKSASNTRTGTNIAVTKAADRMGSWPADRA